MVKKSPPEKVGAVGKNISVHDLAITFQLKAEDRKSGNLIVKTGDFLSPVTV